jgi:hypothetical protein
MRLFVEILGGKNISIIEGIKGQEAGKVYK